MENKNQLMKQLIDALTKQKPMKPIFRADAWYCGTPGCRTLLGAGGTQEEDKKTSEYSKFCRKCGQAVKWE